MTTPDDFSPEAAAAILPLTFYPGTARWCTPARDTLEVMVEGIGLMLLDAAHPQWDEATAMDVADPPAAPLPPPPAVISDRQFAHGLALAGLISEAEALAWVKTGDLPAAIDAFVAGLPASERFGATMVLSGAVEFRRDHPMTAAFGESTGMDAAALDAFWRSCAAL